MKRVTVSLPDDVANDAQRDAGDRGAENFSAYVTEALRAYTHSDPLGQMLTDAEREAGPIPENIRREVDQHMDQVFGSHRPAQEQPASGTRPGRRATAKPGRRSAPRRPATQTATDPVDAG